MIKEKLSARPFFTRAIASAYFIAFAWPLAADPQEVIVTLPDRETRIQGCGSKNEIEKNFRWLHQDAVGSARSAWVQGRLLRASSVTGLGNIGEIRKAYKDGQEHNASAAALIDNCDDKTIGDIAYRFAENTVRLKACGDQAPASSATCPDLAENLRWSFLNNKDCSPFAREWMARAMKYDETDKVRAEFVRRAIQVAEGHNPAVAKSVDFISDSLILQIAEKVYRQYEVAKLDHRPADPKNPFVTQACPGVLLADKF